MKNNAKILTLSLLFSASIFAADIAEIPAAQVNEADMPSSVVEANQGRFSRVKNYVDAKATATNVAVNKVVHDTINATWNNRPRATAVVLTVAAIAALYGIYKAVTTEAEQEEVTF